MLHDTAKLEQKLAAIDAERAPLVALIEAAKAYERTLWETQPDTSDANQDDSQPIKPARVETVTAKTEALAMQLIESRQRPVPTRDVVQEMRERGLPLPDKNELNVVSARLSSSDKLKGRRDMGWWPVNRPWPGEMPKGPGNLPARQESQEEPM